MPVIRVQIFESMAAYRCRQELQRALGKVKLSDIIEIIKFKKFTQSGKAFA